MQKLRLAVQHSVDGVLQPSANTALVKLMLELPQNISMHSDISFPVLKKSSTLTSRHL